MINYNLYLVLYFVLAHFYYKQIKAAKRYNKRRIKSYSLSLILLLIALIFELIDEYFHKYTNNNNSHSYLFDIKTNKYILLNYTIAEIIIIFCLFCSQIIVFYVTLVSFRVHPSAKDITDPNSKFFQSIAIDLFTLRFGILIMIVTGESILAILINPKINSYNGYCSIFVSFLLIYIIQQIYFDTYATNCEHALHCIFKPGSVAWVFAHLPLSYFITCIGLYSVTVVLFPFVVSFFGLWLYLVVFVCLFVILDKQSIGVGFKLLMSVVDVNECPKVFKLLLGVSLSFTWLFIILTRLSHWKYWWYV